MGSLTTTFEFYKPDPEEAVDPETQLNRFLREVDKLAKHMLEYGITDVESISDDPAIEKRDGYRWFKFFSNSFWYYLNGDTHQDAYAHVDNWVSLVPYLHADYEAVEDQPPLYSIESSTGATTIVHMQGAVVRSDGASIVTNTTFNLFTAMPSDIRPTVNKYFMLEAGNTVAQYSIARALI